MQRIRTVLVVLSMLLALPFSILLGPLAGTARADAASPVTIGMTASPNPVASGGQLTYTIVVTNTGGARVDEVKLTDQVPGMTGLILTSTVGTCSQSAGLVTCTAGTLDGGESWTVKIRGTVNAADGTALNNTATVSGTKSAQTFTVTATTETLVANGGGVNLPDLTLSIAAPASVGDGVLPGPVTYNLTVNNTGSANATGVKVVNTLPGGFEFVSASGTNLFSCSTSGGPAPNPITVTCTGGAVNAGMNASITIHATAPASPGSYTNTAAVDPDNVIAEVSDSNNTASAVTKVPAPPPPTNTLAISKSDNPDPVRPGDLLTYTIVVTNTATTRADDVKIVDGTQGLDASSITATATKGFCTVSAPLVTCTDRNPGLRLGAGESMSVVIKGTVVASAGAVLTNTATVSGNIKNTGHSQTATTTTTVRPGVDLSITQVTECSPASPLAPFCVPQRADAEFNYVIVVGNSGLDDANGVVVRQPLPAGVRFKSFAASPGSGFACSESGGVVTCSNGTVQGANSSGQAGGTTREITLTVIAPPSTGSIQSTVSVDPSNAIHESDETNNTATTSVGIQTGVNLTIAHTSNNPVATSGNLAYDIRVSNQGTQDATGVRVRQALPAGVRFRSAEGDHNFTCAHDGAATGGNVVCTGGILAGTHNGVDPVDEATITVRVFAPAVPGLIGSQVRVDPDGTVPEFLEDDNLNTVKTDITVGGPDAFNELTIQKEQTSPNLFPNKVSPSGTLVYRITVGNTGSDPAFNVAVRDFLPTGARFVSAVGAPLAGGNGGFFCTHASGVVECTGGSLASGGSTTIDVKVFAPETPATYPNQAIVDPNNQIPEGNETNNSHKIETIVEIGGGGGFIDLTVSGMTDAPDPVAPLGTLTYTITVANLGTDRAFNVPVRIVPPAGTSFVSASGGGNFTCSHSGGVVNCTGGTINGGGASENITIQVLAPNQHGITITGQAAADPDNVMPEADETNNTGSVASSVQSPINLKLTKAGPTSASQSQKATYTITATNEGSDPAHGVLIRDPMPVGMIVLGVNTKDPGTNNFSCQVEENPVNKVECVGDLDAKTRDALATLTNEVVIEIEVFMTAESGTRLDNEACVDPANTIVESEERDNCSTASTTIGTIDLTVTVDDGFDPVTPGQTQVYSVNVSNIGTVDATGVVVRDVLPASLTFVDAEGQNGFTCTHAAGTVECTGNLTAGQSAVLTIRATVASGATGPITNTVAVDPDGTIAEGNESNNSDSESTAVGGSGIDLVLSAISDNPDPVNQGSMITYTFTAQNTGTSAAANVPIRAVLPASGLDNVSAAGSDGFLCTVTLPNVDCVGDLGAGKSTTITISAQVSSAAPAELSVSAKVDEGDTIAESNEGNNTQTTKTTVTAAPCTGCVDLVMGTMLDTPDPVAAGSELSYTVSVANAGDTATGDISAVTLVRDVLPAEVTFVSASANGGATCAYVAAGHKVECTLPGAAGLNPGAGITITIKVTVNAGTASGTTFNNSATADPDGGISEFNEANNTSTTATTTVS